MRSLYVRITASFLLIVLLSMGISFLMANSLFRKNNSDQMENRLFNTLESVERLYNVSAPRALPMLLQETAMMQGLSIVAVAPNGQYIAAGPRSEGIVSRLTAAQLQHVFNGRTERIEMEKAGIGAPRSVAIGHGARFGGMQWAVFMMPSYQPEFRSFQRNTYSILFTILIAGGY
ncbi:hypothetical protein [Paenibacillus protaetiae]|uniref:Two-component sensor histidine kinase n=1 Tax=Paenibacillus protaetiae TaxID=2509456 RepID=A0A4P6EVS2_9BACL|nr:hypothetical protein [Paenibacillus protaetiae]QAY67104.1 hypothetical protein ET464_12555 [Paenibacillus protaetiae]